MQDSVLVPASGMPPLAPGPFPPVHKTGDFYVALIYFCIAVWYAYPVGGHVGVCCLYMTLSLHHAARTLRVGY